MEHVSWIIINRRWKKGTHIYSRWKLKEGFFFAELSVQSWSTNNTIPWVAWLIFGFIIRWWLIVQSDTEPHKMWLRFRQFLNLQVNAVHTFKFIRLYKKEIWLSYLKCAENDNSSFMKIIKNCGNLIKSKTS